MRKTICTLLVGFICLSSNVAFGVDAGVPGHEWLLKCEAAVNLMDNRIQNPGEEDYGNGFFCLGLMQGINHLNLAYQGLLGKEALYCVPPNLNNGPTAQIVVKYLKEHPERLHEEGIILVVAALKEAFPCK
jgi:hypothetical protein